MMNRAWQTLLVLLAALPIAGTAQGTASRTSSDTVVVTAQRPVHPGVATLIEELSIGVNDGAEQYMFGEIADIAVGTDGSMYIFDRQVPVIRQYNARGTFVRNIGRKGQGPGEYLSTSGLAIARDGRLLLWDTGNWRINVYSASGDVLTHWLTPSGSSGGAMSTYSRALQVDTSGRVITRKTIFDVRDTRNRPTAWLRYTQQGVLIDTVSAPPAARMTPALSASTSNSRVTQAVCGRCRSRRMTFPA